MRTIAIINQKGGCGKTTTAINLAGILARRGYRVLLVDLDPQSHCAAGLAIPEQRIDLDIGDAMLALPEDEIDPSRLLWRASRNLDLAPSRMKLAGLEAGRGGLAEKPDREKRLAGVLARLARGYDVCLIDCSPSIGLLTYNALAAATDVIIPVETSFFALQGATKQVNTVRTLARRIGTTAPYWLVATIHDESSALARDLLEELRRRFGKRVAPVVVRRDPTLKEAASFGQPIIEYAGTSDGAKDYTALADWLTDVIGLGAGAPPGVPQVADEPEPVLDETGVPMGRGPSPRIEVVGTAEAKVGLSRKLAAEDGGTDPARAEGPVAAVQTVTVVAGALEMPLARAVAGRSERVEVLAGAASAAPGRSGGATVAVQPASLESGVVRAPAIVESALAPTRAEDLAQRARLLLLKRADEQLKRVSRAPAPGAIMPGAPSPAASQNLAPGRSPIYIEPAPLAAAPARAAEVADPAREAAAREARLAAVRKLFGARSTRRGVLFVQPMSVGSAVSIAGDFNSWSPTAHALSRNEGLGVYEACVPMPPGRHQYRLVIDGRWTADPFNNDSEPNPFGELNSVVEVL